LIDNNSINNISTNNDKNEALIIRPDIVTFNSLIKGEIHNGSFDKAKILMHKMLECDYIKPDSDLLNTLLDGCEKCKSYNDALTILDLFRKKNVSGNMMTYSILLKILGILGDFENSQKIFDEIKSNKNIAMNLIIITCFIKTCFSTNHLKEAIDTFNSLKKYKIKPDAISYVTMINGIINNSSLSDKSECATEIINLIKKSACDGIILYDNIYIKVLKYLKKIDNYIFENLVKYLRDKELFDYQYKGNKNNNYNYNYNYNNINEKNNKEINEEYNKENEKENINYKNKYNEYNDNRYDYNNKRKPLKQISYNNYNNISLNDINQNQNNKWNKNDYYNNGFKYYGNNDEKNIGYSNYNNFATNNNKWKNAYNKDKVYYNKKKGNNYY
jgi:pentatricopeptide repeat protein